MHSLRVAVDILLAGYVTWEVIRFIPQYRELKRALAVGDPRARTRVYLRALVFEWVSVVLAMIALGFDWHKLNPQSLDLAGSEAMQAISRGGELSSGLAAGMTVGLVLGTVAFIVGRRRARRRGPLPASNMPTPWWRNLIPDFSALIPVTVNERLLWVIVAVSAGICEEIVFRGWLLAMLHEQAHIRGIKVIVIASILFGLAHLYQKVTGVILTSLAGAVFCILYVTTGSLLLPIVLHCLVDVRFAFMPAPGVQKEDAYA